MPFPLLPVGPAYPFPSALAWLVLELIPWLVPAVVQAPGLQRAVPRGLPRPIHRPPGIPASLPTLLNPPLRALIVLQGKNGAPGLAGAKGQKVSAPCPHPASVPSPLEVSGTEGLDQLQPGLTSFLWVVVVPCSAMKLLGEAEPTQGQSSHHL